MQAALALEIGPPPGRDDDVLSDAHLRAVYLEHKDWLLARSRPGERPWAWWRFTDGVPESLRAERPKLLPADDYDGEAVREQEDDLQRRRAAWLADHHGARPDDAETEGRT